MSARTAPSSAISPHAPLKAPDEFEAPFAGKVDAQEADYLGIVANLDHNIGRPMNRLRDLGQEENTIVILMNDNGQTHGLDVYNAGMRGSKCTIWQGGSRAISFWKWPAQWKSHEVQNLTAHLDVLPTLCDVAGAAIPSELSAKLEGFTLRPLLESSQPIPWRDDRLLFHHVGRWPSGMAASHKYAMASVQAGDFLLVRSRPCEDPECKKYSSQCTTLRSVEAGATRATYTKANAQFHWGVTPDGRWSLFDLKNDRNCQKDLSSEKSGLVTKWADAYDKWWDTLYPRMIQLGGDKGEPDALKNGQTDQ
jgi:arylsulfatase A-like enzyme